MPDERRSTPGRTGASCTHPRRPGSGASLAPSGATLIELLIVLALVAVLVLISVAGYRAVRRSARLDSAAQQLVADLQRARSEAVRRNQVVTVVRSGEDRYEIDGSETRRLPEGAVFDASSTDTVRFAPFGPTLTGPGSFLLRSGDERRTVSVSAVGFASVE